MEEAGPVQDVPSKNRENQRVFPIIAIFALIAIILQAVHNYITSPIQVGRPLAPGTWKSKCGLLGLFPHHCQNAFLQVQEDGVVSLYDAHQNLDFKMEGAVCTKEDCVDGLLLEEDGHISIGGKQVKKIVYYDDAAKIVPWPFAETPKAKLQRFNAVSSSETTFLTKAQRIRSSRNSIGKENAV